MSTSEGCASIADKTTGKRLFYTDGVTVWNSNHLKMTNGGNLLGDASSTQSAIIIPKPGSDSLFYIFTVDAQDGFYTGNAGMFCYNLVDMTQSGGLGAVTVKNQVLMSHMTEKIAGVRACNGLDIWVIAHEFDSDAFYAYLITPSGISAPVITHIGIVHTDIGSGVNGESIGYMKCSPDGKKLALACYEKLNTVQIFDFNNATGVISNPITDKNYPNLSGTDGPYGVSFSPDNSKLYIGYLGYSTTASKVYQYNMLAGNGAAIIASRTVVATTPNVAVHYGALQIGPDGKLYLSKTAAYIDVFNKPNLLGAACNHVNNAVAFSGAITAAYGLPVIVESFLVAPFTATLTYPTGCSGSSILVFTDSTINGTINCSWNFDDPASGASNTSTLQNPTHTFSSPGVYSVKAYFTNSCGTDSLTQTVTITSGTVSATAEPHDTSFCDGNFIQLQATGGINYQWSPATGLSDPNVANPIAFPSVSTTYTVTVSPPPCGDSTATVNIVVYPVPPTPKITQSFDTLFCSIDTSYVSYQWYQDNLLIPGATGTFYIAGQNGNYNVAVKNKNGCLISVGINVIVTGMQTFMAQGLKFTISPNPVNQTANIRVESRVNETIGIAIVDMLGQSIYSKQFEIINTQAEIPIDISALSRGVYILQVTTAAACRTGRFIKE